MLFRNLTSRDGESYRGSFFAPLSGVAETMNDDHSRSKFADGLTLMSKLNEKNDEASLCK
jgi:hypothetical protein